MEWSYSGRKVGDEIFVGGLGSLSCRYSINRQAPRWSCLAFASNSAGFARYARETLPSSSGVRVP